MTVTTPKGAKPSGFSPKMSKGQHRRIAKAIVELGAYLGLREWTFTLNMEAIKDDDQCVLAMVEVIAHRQHAVIELCSGFMELEPREMLLTLTHELVHCHTGPLRWFYANLEDVLGSAAWAIAEGSMTQLEETMVDNLSVVIVDLMDCEEAFASSIYGKKNRTNHAR